MLYLNQKNDEADRDLNRRRPCCVEPLCACVHPTDISRNMIHEGGVGDGGARLPGEVNTPLVNRGDQRCTGQNPRRHRAPEELTHTNTREFHIGLMNNWVQELRT